MKDLLAVSIGGYDINSVVGTSGYEDIDSVIDSKIIDAINYFVGFAAVIAVVMIIYAGYMFITSSGDPEKVEKGQKSLTAAVIGLIIVFLARTLIFYVMSLITGA